MHFSSEGGDRTQLGLLHRALPIGAVGAGQSASMALGKLLGREGVIAAVAVVDDAGRVLCIATAANGEPLVLGRHARAQLRVHDEGIALRQLCLLPRLHQGRVRVSAWDLRTELPFVTEARQRASSMQVDGDFSVALGPYTILVRTRTGAHARARDAECITRSGVMPYLGEEAIGNFAVAELESRCGPETLRFRVTADSLARGILVGRYERCGIQAPAAKLSRVHVLLVELDGEPWAIDLASTNGTWRDGVPIFASPLHHGDMLACAGVSLLWRAKVNGAA